MTKTSNDRSRSLAAAMRWATVTLALVVVLVAAPAWADFKAGVEAYERGDYATALTEFRPVAQQGDAEAQTNLGFMYSKGQGAPQDYVQAYMWVNLAVAQGREDARKARDILAEQMTLAQMDEARRLARKWKPKQ